MKKKTSWSMLSSSVEDTLALGRRLGRLLRRGDVLLLFSTLGGGKTTFTQGLLKGMGGHDLASSPTFIMAQTFEGRVPLHHMDFYRLNEAQLIAKGVQDYFIGEGAIKPGVVVIEWPERGRDLWPQERLDVKIRLRSKPTERKFEFIPHGPRYAAVVKKLAAA